MEFEDKIVLEGFRKVYFEYSPATGVLCITGELQVTRLSGLMGTKAGSRTDNP